MQLRFSPLLIYNAGVLKQSDSEEQLEDQMTPMSSPDYFDYMIYVISDKPAVFDIHAQMVGICSIDGKCWLKLKLRHELGDSLIKDSSSEDFQKRVVPTMILEQRYANIGTNVFLKLGSILALIPFYELFEKRICVFEHDIGQSGLFYVFRVKGDTSQIAEAIRSISFWCVDSFLDCQIIDWIPDYQLQLPVNIWTVESAWKLTVFGSLCKATVSTPP